MHKREVPALGSRAGPGEQPHGVDGAVGGAVERAGPYEGGASRGRGVAW